jgi:hypothetical protein
VGFPDKIGKSGDLYFPIITQAVDITSFKLSVQRYVFAPFYFIPGDNNIEINEDYYKEHFLRYKFYRRGSGRDQFLRNAWGNEMEKANPRKEKTYKRPDDATLRKKRFFLISSG